MFPNGTRVINTFGPHSITSADSGKLIICDAGCELQFDNAANLGSASTPFYCEVYKRGDDSQVIYIKPATGETFDGAPEAVVAITRESVKICSDGTALMALSDWRHNDINSHRTVSVDACQNYSYNVALKDFGREVRVTTQPAGGVAGGSIGIYLPNSAQIVSPTYRGRSIRFRRVDDGHEQHQWTVTVFAASGESINQGASFALNGLNTYIELYMTAGQSWFWGVDKGWGNPT